MMDTTPLTNTEKLINVVEDKFQMEKDKQDLTNKCAVMSLRDLLNDSKESQNDKRFYDFQLTSKEEFQVFSNYTDKKTENLQNLSNECAKMSLLSCIRDSMISEEDRRWYRFSTLKKTDKAYVRQNALIYRKFYENLLNTVIIRTSSGSINWEDFRNEMKQLKTKLEKVYETAKIEIKKSSSKLVYNMHQTFISEYEKLNWIIRDMENAALSEMLTAAESGWKKALKDIDVLKAQMTDMSDKMLELTNTNAIMADTLKHLLKKIESYEETQKTLLQQNKDTQNILIQQNNDIKELIRKQNSPPPEK